MRIKTKARIQAREPRVDEVLEFVFNEEEEALCSEHVVVSQQRNMPALQEHLQEMSERDWPATLVRHH